MKHRLYIIVIALAISCSFARAAQVFVPQANMSVAQIVATAERCEEAAEYIKAAYWYERALTLVENDAQSMAVFTSLAATNYYLGKEYEAGCQMYKLAYRRYFSYLGISFQDIFQGKVSNNALGALFYCYAQCNNHLGESEDNLRLTSACMVVAAKCGYQKAIDFCRANRLNYQTKTGHDAKIFD